MPPGGIVGEVSATESWSARQWGWTNILAELPRMPRRRTFENPLGELRRIPLPRTRVNSSLGLSTTDRHRPPEHEAVRSYPWLRQKYEERIKGRGEKE